MNKIAIVDVETTGLDPTLHELISVSIVCVEVDGASGDLLNVGDSYFGQRELTHAMSPAAELLTGIRSSDLNGLQLDSQKIATMIRRCKLVIAHNAEFDRAFIARHVPVLARMPWRCSLNDIDWFGVERVTDASLDYLLAMHGLPHSNGTPVADCHALIQILTLPLPVSGGTGFLALLPEVAPSLHHSNCKNV